jgi:transposase-like protein
LEGGDGALGFWKAMRQVWDTTKGQRCWEHKTASVLDKLPKGTQPKAKKMLHEVSTAEGRAKAEEAFDLFVRTFEAKYPKATECLVKDREALLTFYDFPAEHWLHIRTTNPIESVFSTVRLRHDKTKGNGSRSACLTMVFKLMESASKGLAIVERFAAAGRGRERDGFHRRRQGEARRLKNLQTQLLTIPQEID